MRLLVSNDDGVTAPGLATLVGALAAVGHEVTVAAPTSERSGSATSLGTVIDGDAVPAEHHHEIPGAARVVALDAPPALAVRAGCLGCFGPPPQLVVAGINPGFNTGRMALHSGTLGAALTGLVHDVPGIAVSVARDGVHGDSLAAEVASAAVDALAAEPEPLVINLNVPDRPPGDLAGVGETALGARSVVEIDLTLTDDGLRVIRVHNDPPFASGTDADLLSRGYVSVCPVSVPWAPAPSAERIVRRLAATL